MSTSELGEVVSFVGEHTLASGRYYMSTRSSLPLTCRDKFLDSLCKLPSNAVADIYRCTLWGQACLPNASFVGLAIAIERR